MRDQKQTPAVLDWVRLTLPRCQPSGLERIEATPDTPPGWFCAVNTDEGTIAFCGPPRAPGETGQGHVIRAEDLPAMYLELLATMDAHIEAAELDQQNHGARMAAEALLKIARTGKHRGTFGGKEMEECAQVILSLHERANRIVKTVAEATEKKEQ